MKFRNAFVSVLALLVAVSLCGCSLLDKLTGGGKASSSESGPESSEVEIDPEYPVDAGGTHLTARPGKVISLAPSLTEKLFDLGMDDRLVGVSDYCDYPGLVTGLPPCGTAQIPDIEVISALSPHLVLSEANLPDDAIEALEALNIPVAVFPRAESVESLMRGYVDLARLMEGEYSGATIGNSVANQYKDMLTALRDALIPYTQENGRKKALYLRLLDFTVATGDTFENELLGFICMDNIAADYTGWNYPAEDANSQEGRADFMAVDVIFMDEDFVTIKNLEQSAFYKGLPATIKDRYLYISSIIIERQSMRILDTLTEMASYTYPDAVPPGGFDLGGGFYTPDNTNSGFSSDEESEEDE